MTTDPVSNPTSQGAPADLRLTGRRFSAVYHLRGTQEQAAAIAADICIEQTVEFPADLITRHDIRKQIFGRVAALRPISDGHCEAVIEYAVEIVGKDLTQLLNVLFGNISLKPGIRLVHFELPDPFALHLPGPRFGRAGLRKLLGVERRPLLCTALKPMGLSPQELAARAYAFALGGIDLIKDDHGLADQPFCPFSERVRHCAEAVAKANRATGKQCRYFPNVTAPADELWQRASAAKSFGAGGLLLAPALIGPDAVRMLAADDRLGLPIMIHPAFTGSFALSPDEGIAHGVLFGEMARLLGADACIFPSYGGRFSFSRDECRDIVIGTARPMGTWKPIFPVPAGGMPLARVAELIEFYGFDTILLIGGDLHRQGSDWTSNCRRFIQQVERCVQSHE